MARSNEFHQRYKQKTNVNLILAAAVQIKGEALLSVIFKDNYIKNFSTYIATNIFEQILSFQQMLDWQLTNQNFPFKQTNINLILNSKLLNNHQNQHHNHQRGNTMTINKTLTTNYDDGLIGLHSGLRASNNLL